MSRFVKEIPEDFLEQTGRNLYEINREYGGTWRDSSAAEAAHNQSHFAGYGENAGFRSVRKESVPCRKDLFGTASIGTRSASSQVRIELQKGEMVVHDAFGQGMVVSITPMGGDALLEIAFDNVGTKRLMYKSASSHLKKV